MVIDLSKYLNKVAVDQETKTADVDGGALWRDVDNATCPLGLATVAGTVNEVTMISPHLAALIVRLASQGACRTRSGGVLTI
jgi:hypothetical protein